MSDVDRLAAGLVDEKVDPKRYGNYATDVPQEVATLLIKHLPPRSRVLDIGCGNGILSELMRDRSGCEVLGLEPDADRAAAVRQRGIKVEERLWTEETAHEMPVVDVVTFMDVLEHLAEPYDALLLAKQVLTAGGYVIASVPNVAHWTVRLSLLRGRFNYDTSGIMDATHLRWFTRRTFRELFERAGFDIAVEDVSANVRMPFYARFPWSMLRTRRFTLIRALTRAIPRLFGVQLFVVARKRAAG